MNKNIFDSFLSYLSPRKNGRYLACAKSVLSYSENFYEYIKTGHFCFAQSFSLGTGTLELIHQKYSNKLFKISICLM